MAAIKVNPEILNITRTRHYHQFDTYMKFDDPSQGYVRYREDHFVAESGEITSVRNRLTLIGQTREHPFSEDVLLSRSRFLAPATQSLRFYKEYFKPSRQLKLKKTRIRYLVTYKETEFFINVDNFDRAKTGYLSLK